MTDDRLALVDLLQKSGSGDFLRSVAEAVLQILMEADVEGLIGAGRHERSAERLNYRNGYRERSLLALLARAVPVTAISPRHRGHYRGLLPRLNAPIAEPGRIRSLCAYPWITKLAS
jgi:hypothetical protein